MATTSQEYSQRIRAQLKTLDPDISADPLTPERKIIDTVAEVLADSQIDTYIQTYQYDIDTKVGSDLDKFVALFGFGRQVGRRATGVVTFSRNSPAEDDILIPAGTEIIKPQTLVSPVSIFFTTATVIMAQGTTTIDAPIEASAIGPNGNVAAGTIIGLGTGTPDISEVSNAVGTTGGTDPETDAEFRVRFKNTIFRNIAGTKDQYLALAIASRFANKANVIGPQSRYSEFVQVPQSRTIVSQIPYSKYTYNYDYYLTDGDPTSETFYFPRGVDYTFTASVPPSISVNAAQTTLTGTTTLPSATVNVASTTGFPSTGTVTIGTTTVSYSGTTGVSLTGCTGGSGTFPTGTTVTSGTLIPGTVVLFEHTYCSINSRNDPANNIANYVDVFVSGADPTDAVESVAFPDASFNFNNSAGSPYYVGKFKRTRTSASPVVGNRFQELLWQPALTLPSSVIIDGRPFYQGTDYWQVSDTTTYANSRRSRDGIEWSAAAAASITAGTLFVLDYTFDKLPITLNEIMDAHKQVTSDVLVHSANERYLNVNLVIMYTAGFSKAPVDTAIVASLTNFFDRQLFGSVIQISDVLEVVHEVPGVDNVRLASPSDGVAYGIQEVALDGTTFIGGPHVTDFFLADSDLPVLNKIVASQRSQNTW
jgi:uncharacterized phage protein gp47/JayE